MRSHGHLSTGVFLSAILLAIFHSTSVIFFVVGLLFSVRIPHAERQLPLINHRSYLHTIWGAIIVGVVFFLATLFPLWLVVDFISSFLETADQSLPTLIPPPIDVATPIGIGGVAGVTLHIIGDIISPLKGKSRCRPFAPIWNRRFAFPQPILTHSSIQMIFLFWSSVLFVVVVGYRIWQLG